MNLKCFLIRVIIKTRSSIISEQRHLNQLNKSLFHKTFSFVIYGKMVVNYGIFAIYEQIYGQNLAAATNP